MRLEHIFEAGEDATLAQPVPIELNDILTTPIANVKETDLSGSQVSPVRLTWKSVDSMDIDESSNEMDNGVLETDEEKSKAVINIRPSEIRTFVLTFA
jgi:hypothetical protein